MHHVAIVDARDLAGNLIGLLMAKKFVNLRRMSLNEGESNVRGWDAPVNVPTMSQVSRVEYV